MGNHSSNNVFKYSFLENTLRDTQKVLRFIADDCDQTPECPLLENGIQLMFI
jgi:hypothetical protein